MGLLGKMVIKAVAKKAGDIALLGVADHMEKTRSVDAIIDNSTAHYMFFIEKKKWSSKHNFIVYDDFHEKKYEIETDSFTFGHPAMSLYDLNCNEIGNVELSSKFGMGTYTLSIRGNSVGTVTPKTSVKTIFDLKSRGWHLEGNLMHSSYNVTDKNGNTVMKFNNAFDSRYTYILEMDNQENKVWGLLLVMLVELMSHND